LTPQQQMVSKLIGAATSDTGCNIVALASSPAAQGMALSELRAACSSLRAAGSIYPTIDADNFKLCDDTMQRPPSHTIVVTTTPQQQMVSSLIGADTSDEVGHGRLEAARLLLDAGADRRQINRSP
jgi:hypothetical protein